MKGVHPDSARWAILKAIESGDLRAVIQTAEFDPPLTKPALSAYDLKLPKGSRKILKRPPSDDIKQQETPSQTPGVEVASAMPAHIQGLLVWSKTQKSPAPKRGARPKTPMSSEEERRIMDAWTSRTYRTYAELARARNKGESGKDIRKVIDRIETRRRRQKPDRDK